MYTDSFQRFLEKESLNEKQNMYICPSDVSTEDRQSAKPFIYILYTCWLFLWRRKKKTRYCTRENPGTRFSLARCMTKQKRSAARLLFCETKANNLSTQVLYKQLLLQFFFLSLASKKSDCVKLPKIELGKKEIKNRNNRESTSSVHGDQHCCYSKKKKDNTMQAKSEKKTKSNRHEQARIRYFDRAIKSILAVIRAKPCQQEKKTH